MVFTKTELYKRLQDENELDIIIEAEQKIDRLIRKYASSYITKRKKIREKNYGHIVYLVEFGLNMESHTINYISEFERKLSRFDDTQKKFICSKIKDDYTKAGWKVSWQIVQDNNVDIVDEHAFVFTID